MKDMNRTGAMNHTGAMSDASTMTHDNNMNHNEKGDVSMNTTAKTRTANKTHTPEKAAACSENRANRYQSLYTFNPENLKAFDLYSPAMKKAAKESGNSGMSYAKATPHKTLLSKPTNQ